MKQRLGIAMAIMSFPKLLILDEPTNGLDPAGIGENRELIKSLPQRYEMTVLVSSHLLSEIEQTATKVGIINNGIMMFQGTLEDLKKEKHPAIMIRTGNNELALELLLKRGYTPLPDREFLLFENLSDEQISHVIKILISDNIDVFRIEERKKNLESIFLDMTGKGSSL